MFFETILVVLFVSYKCATGRKHMPLMRKSGPSFFVFAALLGLAVAATFQINDIVPGTSPADTNLINNVKWEPIPANQVFPAAILSTVGMSHKPEDSPILCEPHSFARVRVHSPTDSARVHVEVHVDGFSETSVCDAVLNNAGQDYVLAPTIRWDVHKLAHVDEPSPATVVFHVKVNDVDLGENITHVQIRASNDVPYAHIGINGTRTDSSYLFAAFVDENSRVVERILKEALQWGAVPAFSGYQRGPDYVRMQVFAIWNVLQRHNLKYSSITTASGFSKDVQSQSVRFVDDALSMSQANCVDGTVLFASVLYKIGIFPVLVMKPGHMFLGYFLKPEKPTTLESLQFLETTMLGSGIPVVLHDKPFPRHDQNWLETTPSYRDFMAATAVGSKEFEGEVRPNLGRERFHLIDVREQRARGINPIPR
jgi:hypothetical protein